MAWVRTISEPPVRRTVDIVKFATAVALLVLIGVYAQAQTQIDASFYAPINQLTDSLDGVFRFGYVLGSPWAIPVVVGGLLLLRRWDVALRGGLAAGAAWGVAALLQEILDPHAVSGVDVRWGDGPMFPAVNVAIATALLFAISAYLVRPLRRLLVLVVVYVAIATMYLGVGLPSDVLGGALLGYSAAALVAFLLGTISGKPQADEVRDALVDLGYSPTGLTASRMAVGEASVFDVVMESGDTVRVDAYGRDQRETQVAARLWHRAMYKEPGTTVFGSRVQHLEHVAYATLLAARAGVRVPELVVTGVGGPDAALLVTRPPEGSALSDLEPDQITDGMLRDTWSALVKLHEAGVTHGNLDLTRVVATSDGVALDDFAAAGVSADTFWAHRDGVALLVDTALRVGYERAIAATVDVLGKEEAGALIPTVQPAALPPGVGADVKHLSKDLKALRALLAEATGADDVAPLQIKRLTAANIGILIGVIFALCIAIPSLQGIDWQIAAEGVRERDLGMGGARARALPVRPVLLGHRAPRLRQHGPPVRAHRARAARVHLLEPHHAERHRRHRAADRLPPQAGGAGGVCWQRDGAVDRRGRRHPDGALPRRRRHHRDQPGQLRHRWRQREPVDHRARRGRDRDHPVDPEDPREGRPRGDRAPRRTSGRCCATPGRRCSSSAVTRLAT